MDNILLDQFTVLCLVIILATCMAGIMHLLKQPLIIGHIATGLIVGPYILNLPDINHTLPIFSQLGTALLLFVIGLSLSPKIIHEVGRVSLITGVGQIIFTSLFGFYIGRALGFEILESAYIGIALTFSSTIIILKLLYDKNDLNQLYGKIAIGILLIQDMIAAIILIGISASAASGNLAINLSLTFVKGIIVTGIIALVSYYIMPRLSLFIARSQELLFLFAIAWGLGLALLFQILGFSIEIGALIAGVSLATSPYSYEIAAKMKPLRDFFVVLFFILIGSKVNFSGSQNLILPALMYSLFIIIGKPIRERPSNRILNVSELVCRNLNSISTLVNTIARSSGIMFEHIAIFYM